MIALLVAASDHIEDVVRVHLEPLGFDYVRYRQVLKAMDNIDEVNPDALIISAEDFPRHWKTLVQYVRNERPRDKTSIILLKGEHFSFEEAAKAAHIGVNGIVEDDLSTEDERERLKGILARHAPVQELRHMARFMPAAYDRFSFIFTHPATRAIIRGSIESFSLTGLLFKPHTPALLEDLGSGAVIKECTLRAGNNFLSPLCRVVRTGRIVAIEMSSFLPGEHRILEQYLHERPLRERDYLDHHQRGA